MRDQDKEKMQQLELKVEELTKLHLQLLNAIVGSEQLKTPGIVHRLAKAEDTSVELQKSIEATHLFLYKSLDDIEGSLDRKFTKLAEAIDEKFTSFESFQKDINEFKLYLNIFTNGKAWKILFRLLGFCILVCASLAAWYKGGHDILIKLFKTLIK